MKTIRLNFRVTDTTRLRLEAIRQEWENTRKPLMHRETVRMTDVIVLMVNREYETIKAAIDKHNAALADVKAKRKSGKIQKPKVKK